MEIKATKNDDSLSIYLNGQRHEHVKVGDKVLITNQSKYWEESVVCHVSTHEIIVRHNTHPNDRTNKSFSIEEWVNRLDSREIVTDARGKLANFFAGHDWLAAIEKNADHAQQMTEAEARIKALESENKRLQDEVDVLTNNAQSWQGRITSIVSTQNGTVASLDLIGDFRTVPGGGEVVSISLCSKP